MTSPSWQPDPFHRHEYRWWDSQNWTEHVSDHGVAAIDPLHTPEAPPHPTWAAPTFSPPPPQAYAPAPPVAPKKNQMPMIVGGIAVVAALVVGGFFLLGGDDKTAAPTTSTRPSTTVTDTSSTAPVTTVEATTTLEPTTVPVTAPPASHSQVLQAAMLISTDVPVDWVNYSEGGGTHSPDPSGGLCGSQNSTSLAIAQGSDAQLDGPTWDLPDKGWFGVEAFAFPTEAAADAFVDAYSAQASTCSATAYSYTKPESEAQIFGDNSSPNAVWTFSEVTGVEEGAPGEVAKRLIVMSDDLTISTTVDGHAYSFKYTELHLLERYGPYVFDYWLDGENTHVGFGNGEPDFAYMPSWEALDGATVIARDAAVRQLGL